MRRTMHISARDEIGNVGVLGNSSHITEGAQVGPSKSARSLKRATRGVGMTIHDRQSGCNGPRRTRIPRANRSAIQHFLAACIPFIACASALRAADAPTTLPVFKSDFSEPATDNLLSGWKPLQSPSPKVVEL